jgi:hypothetical protein
MIVVDVIEQFIENLNYEIKILNISYDNITNITTFYVSNYLYVRDDLSLIIDNTNEEKIRSVDYTLKTIMVDNDYTTAKNLKITPPYFLHGTPYATNKELNKLTKYPIVYLLEILKEQIPTNVDSAFETIPTVRLFFLDEANFKSWDTNQLYSNVVTPQRNFCDYVFANIKNSKLFGLPSNVEITSYAKFGQYLDNKGSVNSLFDKTLSGVELKIDLPIFKKCKNKN